MKALQKRQRPPRINHATIGTLSHGRSLVVQTAQCDGGDTIDSPRRSRSNTSATNEPSAAPNAAQKNTATSTS